jgi:hypothetical protein
MVARAKANANPTTREAGLLLRNCRVDEARSGEPTRDRSRASWAGGLLWVAP